MLSKMFTAIVLVCVTACSPQPREEARQLTLYAASTETRLFASPIGFEFPEGVSLEQMFDRESGTLLIAAEASAVSRAVSVIPPPSEVAACAHVWRHVFVFYGADGAPLGALAYCMECGAVAVLGPEDPGVGLEQLLYDGAALDQIIETHGLIVEPEYAE